MREDVMAFEFKNPFDLPYQGFLHLGHRRRSLPPRLHRGLPEREKPDPGLVQLLAKQVTGPERPVSIRLGRAVPLPAPTGDPL